MDKIAVLDFGDQYTQQLANAVRKAGVFSEILPFNTPYDEIVRKGYKGVIFSGSPDFVDRKGSRKCDKKFFDNDDIPNLGGMLWPPADGLRVRRCGRQSRTG